MNFYMPVKLYTGEGCIAAHSAELSELGDRCLIVTGSASAKKSGALDDFCTALESQGIQYDIYSGVMQNPTVACCMEAGRQAQSFGAAFIAGIGGGSALDAAKAAAVFAANPAMDEDAFYSGVWKGDPLPIVLVGTSSGTGSEVTRVSVLTDSKHRKHSIHDDRMFAALAFGEGKYTMSLSRNITLSAGIDVLTHSVESWMSVKSNDLSRAFSAKGVSLLYEPLMAAARGDELTLEQRQQLYDVSILGGLAICVTGTCFPHSLGYYLTENYGVTHGFACAAFFPALIEHAEKCCPEYIGELYEKCGLGREQLLSLTAAVVPEFSFRLTEEEIEAVLPRWDSHNAIKSTRGHIDRSDIKRWFEAYC